MVVCKGAAVTAHEIATIPTQHAVADVAVHVGRVDQLTELLQGEVVVGQISELGWAPHFGPGVLLE